MMCLTANFGLICSLFNWFLIPVAFTPFNIIFIETCNLWWLAALCDGAFTTGIVYLMYICNEYLEKRIEYYEQNTYPDISNMDGYDMMNDETNNVEDITLNKHE